jgi:hypothetical protein
MASAFVVRPFGVRTIKDGKGVESKIDFNEIHAKLIGPAMEQAGISGSTTEVIARAGNIRVDMFQMLALADIVIADISIHNANVFYELGARHGLRNSGTFLIRSAGDEVPFDLKTDRYLAYDAGDPAASVAALAEGLKATLRERKVDSPIFGLLPELKPPAIRHLMPVPEDFHEELLRAKEGKRAGYLMLLGREAGDFPWGAEGVRLVGRALFDLKSWPWARESWERVREILRRDLEADLKLGTVYQRLGDMARSDIAIDRALAHPDLAARETAEARSLKGSNIKQRWLDTWGALATTGERQIKALETSSLRDAFDSYFDGFQADLNHYYSGINALALNRVLVGLAELQPDHWSNAFGNEREAQRQLDEDLDRLRDLEGAVTLAVAREQVRTRDKPHERIWAGLSAAEVQLLRKELPARVAAAYVRALANAPAFYFDSPRRQLCLYAQLGLFSDIIPTVLAKIDEIPVNAESPGRKKHVILFSGHRIDDPKRPVPRFPAASEKAAAAEIRKRIEAEVARVGDADFTGFAGGACGGDIIFHETCAAMGVPTELFLAIPEADYINESVRMDEAPEWLDRFRTVKSHCAKCWTLVERRNPDGGYLPEWLAKVKNYDIWERNNRWNLNAALSHGAENVSVIVLWDGKAGDGPGGTRHMVEEAKKAGAQVIHIDTRALFGL